MIAEQDRATRLRERLDSSALKAVHQRVFSQRLSTLESEAIPYTLDDLRLVFGVTRLGIRSEAEWLPDDAFGEQRPAAEGHEVWSAGQIVNHIGHTQIGLTVWLAGLIGIELAAGPHPLTDLTDVEHPGLLTREQSLHVLDVADRELESLFDTIPTGTDPPKQATHPRFGRAGVKGSVLFMAIHENMHLHQMLSLRLVAQPLPIDDSQSVTGGQIGY